MTVPYEGWDDGQVSLTQNKNSDTPVGGGWLWGRAQKVEERRN